MIIIIKQDQKINKKQTNFFHETPILKKYKDKIKIFHEDHDNPRSIFYFKNSFILFFHSLSPLSITTVSQPVKAAYAFN